MPSKNLQNLSDTVSFTDSAANKVHELIVSEGNLNLKLRISIQGGGCSGYEYIFAFEEEALDDNIFEKVIQGNEKVKFLIDPISFQYLAGAEIDYIEDIKGDRFVIRNPNAQTTCGCGSSFSV